MHDWRALLCAVEEVFSQACLRGADVDMSLFQEVFMSADAFAFSQVRPLHSVRWEAIGPALSHTLLLSRWWPLAVQPGGANIVESPVANTGCVQTISKAIVTCKSDDEDAYECATVTASAEAYARATAQAHAEAVATAVNACGCMTESVSESISDESIYIRLIADAASTATATACIEGTRAALPLGCTIPSVPPVAPSARAEDVQSLRLHSRSIRQQANASPGPEGAGAAVGVCVVRVVARGLLLEGGSVRLDAADAVTAGCGPARIDG